MLRGLISVGVMIAIWQGLVSGLHFPPYILPSPMQVSASLINNANLLLTNAMFTIVEIIIGLAMGILLGMALALLMMGIRSMRFWLLPIIIISQAIPTFAIAPLLVLWFGYGMASKIITITLMLFFPVANAFYEGLARTNQEWLDMATIMGGHKIQTLIHLRLPAALPNLAVGIQVATILAPIGAIVSEWIGASKGLGFLMLNANARLEIDLMFACLVLIMIISLLLYYVVHLLLQRLLLKS